MSNPQTITLYHGTDEAGHAGIMSDGYIAAPVFLSPDRRAAEDYADGGPVIEVQVDPAILCVDLDLPGGRLLSVSEANDYQGSDHQGFTIEDYIRNGYSVGTNEPVQVS